MEILPAKKHTHLACVFIHVLRELFADMEPYAHLSDSYAIQRFVCEVCARVLWQCGIVAKVDNISFFFVREKDCHYLKKKTVVQNGTVSSLLLVGLRIPWIDPAWYVLHCIPLCFMAFDLSFHRKK